MDPVAIALAFITTPRHHRRIRFEHYKAFHAWEMSGGFMPMVEDIGNLARTQGITLPAGWLTVAREIGCKG